MDGADKSPTDGLNDVLAVPQRGAVEYISSKKKIYAVKYGYMRTGQNIYSVNGINAHRIGYLSRNLDTYPRKLNICTTGVTAYAVIRHRAKTKNTRDRNDLNPTSHPVTTS